MKRQRQSPDLLLDLFLNSPPMRNSLPSRPCRLHGAEGEVHPALHRYGKPHVILTRSRSKQPGLLGALLQGFMWAERVSQLRLRALTELGGCYSGKSSLCRDSGFSKLLVPALHNPATEMERLTKDASCGSCGPELRSQDSRRSEETSGARGRSHQSHGC